MDPNSQRWTTVSDSTFDHEREALAFLRRMLPDRDPIKVWSNFEFVAKSGAMYEVDALVVTSAGVFLIEIKSYPGEIGGDAGTWIWTRPDKSFATFDNPRILANRKAKHLASLIAGSDTIRKQKRFRAPFVQEVVFLSAPDLKVSLPPQGRFNVHGRDSEEPTQELPSSRRIIGGIVEAILAPASGDGRPSDRIDRPYSELIAKAINELGIRERSGRRRVGDYRLGDLLIDVETDRDIGVTYQDYVGTHSSADIKRRIRIYPLERNATTESREIASRAARREFQLLHTLDHPGILRPIDFTETDRGPALIFEYNPHDQPLHRWLESPDIAPQLSVEHRLNLIRAIAEALHTAHQRGVIHRALSPSAVLVSGPANAPRIRIGNWHTGARVAAGDASTTGGTTGTVHVEELSSHDATFYRAPEFGQPGALAILLDVFSLGALATLVFTNRPPAESQSAYTEMLITVGHIAADALADGIDSDIAEVIAESTAADPSDRFHSVADFLAGLDLAEEAWTAPDPMAEPTIDEARRGDTLGGGRFQIEHRLGRGSSAIAFEVVDKRNGDRVAVLKVTVDPEHNQRLADEAEAIGKLRQRNIVRLLDGPLDIYGHAALLLSHAGATTLASRMADRPLAELAERFGDDLLEALRHLEQEGVSHRDIKPENIGVAPMGKNEELHLVLFDFSLAMAAIEQIGAGTQGYLDPFLKRRGSWDLHAERYAAAVTLFEMVTGTRPRYGDGTADPAMTDDVLSIDRSAFEGSVSGGLFEFFTKALARETDQRFDTADDMLRAWSAAFEPASRPSSPSIETDGEETTRLIVPAGVTDMTPLAGLPLSNRAVNALEREEVVTVGDLLAFPLNRVPRLTGVGVKTRREIVQAVAALKTAMTSDESSAEPLAVGQPSAGLIDIAAALIPSSGGSEHRTRSMVLTALLGQQAERWPTQSEMAAAAGVTPARVSQIIDQVRGRWAKQPSTTTIRNWLASELTNLAGIATADQLLQRLAAANPDPVADPEELRRAGRAVLRAALITEQSREQPRWVIRRQHDRMVSASQPIDGEGPHGQAMADYAFALAEAAESLIADRSIVPRHELIEALHAVEPPPRARPMADAHLTELATGLSHRIAVNARLELYRKGLSALDALGLTRRAFIAIDKIRPDEIAAKVKARYPDAEALPTRPALDGLLRSAGLEFTWVEEEGVYRAPLIETTATTSPTSFNRHQTGQPTDLTPIEIDTAADFEGRLRSSLDHGGLLVLVSDRHRLESAAQELARFPVTLVDFDELMFNKILEMTANGQPSWELVVAADASGSGTPDWMNLQRLLDRVVPAITNDLFAMPGTVVLYRNGLLARYDRLALVSEWRDSLFTGGHALKALWLLVATPESEAVPKLDNHPVPVISKNEWVRIPREWLENAHRAGVTAGPADG